MSLTSYRAAPSRASTILGKLFNKETGLIKKMMKPEDQAATYSPVP